MLGVFCVTKAIYLSSFFLFSFSSFASEVICSETCAKLVRAVYNKDVQSFKEALAEGADVNCEAFEDPLLLAIGSFAPAYFIVELVFRRAKLYFYSFGAFINAMHRAVELKNIEGVNALLYSAPWLVLEQDFRGWTPKIYAQKLEDIIISHIFAMHHLISSNAPKEAVSELIEIGLKAGFPSEIYKYLCLFSSAAYLGNTEAVGAFMEFMPELAYVQDFMGHIAYDYARAENKQEVMKILPQSFVVRNNHHQKAIFEAIRMQNIHIVDKTIKLYTDLASARSNTGFDPLQYAIAVHADEDIIRLLYVNKIYEFSSSTTIYHVAVRARNLRALKLLKIIDQKFDENIQIKEDDGLSPLERAKVLGSGFEEIAFWLERPDSSLLDSLIFRANNLISSVVN